MSLQRTATILRLVACAIIAQPAFGAGCGTPTAISDGWAIDKPENVAIEPSRLCAIASRVTASDADIHSVVIVRRGRLVFEQYFTGYDDPWGQTEGQYSFDARTKHDMRSVTKSVTSLLVGIAIDRKLIHGIDEPVLKYFPEYAAIKSPGWEIITLRHLLTMSSGIAWDEARAWTDPKNDEPHLGKDADPIRYVLSKPVAAVPDAVWAYNGGGTDLLGTIVERVSGQTLDVFAREALFQPLGIVDWDWKTYQNGKLSAAAGLRLRPRDAAKVGQLVLQHGNWDGQQLVTAKWVEQSIEPRFQALGYFGGLFYYGRHWWMGRTLSGDKDIAWIAAVGLGGQRIIIVPSLELVVVTTSGLYYSPRQGQATLDLLANFIIPSIRDAK